MDIKSNYYTSLQALDLLKQYIPHCRLVDVYALVRLGIVKSERIGTANMITTQSVNDLLELLNRKD